MGTTVTVPQTNKYPFQLIQGGAPNATPFRGRRRGSRRFKTPAELVLEREIRAAFAALEDEHGNIPSEAIKKIRQGVQLPLGVFGRRIVEAHAAKVPHHQVRNIGQAIVDWIDRLYAVGVETTKEQVYYQSPVRVA